MLTFLGRTPRRGGFRQLQYPLEHNITIEDFVNSTSALGMFVSFATEGLFHTKFLSETSHTVMLIGSFFHIIKNTHCFRMQHCYTYVLRLEITFTYRIS